MFRVVPPPIIRNANQCIYSIWYLSNRYCCLPLDKLRFLYSEIFLTLTEVFPCFFLSCKANVRVKLAKTGHSLHSSNLLVFLCCSVVICVVLCIVCVWVCTVLLPPGDNPIAVNEYIIYHIIYHTISYIIFLI
jgi:hypothetical protein